MFHFVCKKLVFHCCRRYTDTIPRSTNYYTDFIIPVLFRWNSTSSITTTSKEESFTVSYLVNSCGFSPKSALLVSKRVKFNSPEKPDSVMTLLKKHGFSEKQILKLVKAFPRLLMSSPEKTLLPKFEFFYSKGFSTSDFAKACASYPYLLQSSLNNILIPSFDHITDLFKSTELAVAFIKSRPDVIYRSWEKYMVPHFNVLRDIGVPEHNFGLFVRWWKNPCMSDVKSLRDAAIEVKEMGIDPSKTQFVLAFVAKLYGETHWKNRVEIFKKYSWSEKEFLTACRINSGFMTLSKDKIIRVMGFLINEMNIEPSTVAKTPNIIGLSVEKRFIPRAGVFEFLLSKGLIDQQKTKLVRIFLLSEKAFLDRFVNSLQEAPELLKLYQEKSRHLSTVRTSTTQR